WLDARMADDGGGVLENFHRGGVDGHAALRARLDETLAGLVVARRAHEAGCRGEPVSFELLVAAARRDLVPPGGPLLEPGGIIAEAIFERASDAIDLVDLDTGPGRGAQANEQAHGPAVVGGKVKESRVVFAADHVLLLIQGERAEAACPGRGAVRSEAEWCAADPRSFHSAAVPDQQCTAARCSVSSLTPASRRGWGRGPSGAAPWGRKGFLHATCNGCPTSGGRRHARRARR